jgi:hypothetical protein
MRLRLHAGFNFFKSSYLFFTIKLLAIYYSLACRAELISASDAYNFFILTIHLTGFVFPPFALMQKVGPKNQGKPEPLRASCHPAHKQHAASFCNNHLSTTIV